MKSAVRMGLVILGLLVVVVVGGGLALRSAWHVEAVEHVRAPPEAVFHYLTDLHKWGGWTFWNTVTDDTATFEFDDHPPGAGERMSWHGERLGDGHLELTAADPRRGVEYREKSGHFEGHGSVELELEQGGTKVTWRESGDVGWNLAARFTLATLERSLAPEFAKSLGRLKSLVEATQPGRPPAEGAALPGPAEAR